MSGSQIPDDVRERLFVEAERAAGIGSWAWEAASGAVQLSDNALRLLGHTRAGLEPTVAAFVETIHPADREKFETLLAESLQAEAGQSIEFRVVRPDGETRTLFCRGVSDRGPDGRLIRTVGTVVDRTEDIARRNEAERIRTLLALSQRIARLGTFIWDPLTDTAEWSGEIASIVGVDDPMGIEAFVGMVHPEDLPRFAAIRETVLRDRVAGPVPIRVRRPDGEIRHLVFHVVSTSNPEISPQIGVLQDVTERTKLENQLRTSETLESVGRLAAGVAHDFNNLMTVMLSNAEELSQERPDERLDQILSAVESGAEMVRRLLSVGRRGPTNPQPVDLNDTMRDLSKWANRVLGDDLELALELTEDPTPVVADPAELHQVVLNLLVNARDAMQAGGKVTLRTGLHNGSVRLEVVDQGVGMAPEVLEHAFDPFFTTKPVGQGTGLGLSMVHGVITGLGGTVSLTSLENQGTEVRISLPRTSAPAVPRESAEAVSTGSKAGTLLLVEDDENVRRVIARILERSGFVVLLASGPKEAEGQLERSTPDVVVTDVSMPDGGGRRVAELVAEACPDVPIVFVTGNAREAALPGPVVHKPFKPGELLSVVTAVLER